MSIFSNSSLTEVAALHSLSPDGRLLVQTRIVRMAAYGLISVVLALYLKEVGLNIEQIGLLFSLTLVGSAAISFAVAMFADQVGRRKMLILGAGLMIFAAIVFAYTNNFAALAIAAVFGTISPNGSEVGPSQSIEQAALPQTTTEKHRTQIYAWYILAGYLAAAVGALISGLLAQSLQMSGATAAESYRAVIVMYGALGVVLAVLFSHLSTKIEVRTAHVRRGSPHKNRMGLHQSRNIVFKWSAIGMIDSFGGGLVMQSFIAYWFNLRFSVDPAILGSIFFGANLLAGLSALAAARVARRIGLLKTMVFTHMPSNVLLMLVPLMPSLPLAIIVLLLRFSLSQMDMPTRQSYLVAIVEPDERSAATGMAATARTLASSVAPTFAGVMMAASLLSLPFFASGGLKIFYDIILLKSFSHMKPPEEISLGPLSGGTSKEGSN